jgi:hypothetical protein
MRVAARMNTLGYTFEAKFWLYARAKFYPDPRSGQASKRPPLIGKFPQMRINANVGIVCGDYLHQLLYCSMVKIIPSTIINSFIVLRGLMG